MTTLIQNYNANVALLTSELTQMRVLTIDTSPYDTALNAIATADFSKLVANALTAEPDKFRCYYMVYVAEILAGRPRTLDLRRRVKTYGY